jgi:hypothetical protein
MHGGFMTNQIIYRQEVGHSGVKNKVKEGELPVQKK